MFSANVPVILLSDRRVQRYASRARPRHSSVAIPIIGSARKVSRLRRQSSATIATTRPTSVSTSRATATSAQVISSRITLTSFTTREINRPTACREKKPRPSACK